MFDRVLNPAIDGVAFGVLPDLLEATAPEQAEIAKHRAWKANVRVKLGMLVADCLVADFLIVAVNQIFLEDGPRRVFLLHETVGELGHAFAVIADPAFNAETIPPCQPKQSRNQHHVAIGICGEPIY